jgi:hypothetical protein
MKNLRTISGPFSERPYFSDGEIEQICLDELRKAKLLPDRPSGVRVERFVEKRFNVTVESAELGEGILGVTKFGPKGVQGVYVSAALDCDPSMAAKRRVRSTIAHEAGHCLLHTYLFAVTSGVSLFGDCSESGAIKVLCRDSEVRSSYRGEWWEFQANVAMSHLLMPRPLVEIASEPFLVPVGLLGRKQINPAHYEYAVRFIADQFEVNPAVSRIRLQSLYSDKEAAQMSL